MEYDSDDSDDENPVPWALRVPKMPWAFRESWARARSALDRENFLSHSGVKQYKCERRFSPSGSLQQHLLTHSGDKPYKCECCKKCFRRSGSLQRHLQTHSYECEHCGKSFSLSGSLRQHLWTCSENKPYKCEHWKAI